MYCRYGLVFVLCDGKQPLNISRMCIGLNWAPITTINLWRHGDRGRCGWAKLQALLRTRRAMGRSCPYGRGRCLSRAKDTREPSKEQLSLWYVSKLILCWFFMFSPSQARRGFWLETPVFLRCLEYFRGILFLTTNRVGSFDDAFISRIHVALHYERLNEEQRHQIWSKNFRRLQREERVEIDPDTFFFSASDPELKAVEWNGREIRNAFQTAVALAQYEARKAGKDVVTLRPEHLKSVVMMSKQFKDYITSTHKNQDETKRAMIEERRNDTFRARKWASRWSNG